MLSKMRLFGFTQPCLRICLANGANSLRVARAISSVSLTVATIVLRQRARIGARIGQHLVPLVERLRERQRHARGEAEAAVGLALQAGQVVEQRRELRRRLGLLGGDAGLAVAGGDDRLGALPRPRGARPRSASSSSFLNFASNQRPGYSPALAPKRACTSQ